MDETKSQCENEGTQPPAEESSESPLVDPTRIGRYRIIHHLGQGGFGRVYLAHDDDLNRPVAIKVPRPERVSRPEDIEAYLNEARILASLDHPHIVPVYDVGRTDDGLCFVVSKLVEGTDLSHFMKATRLSPEQAAGLVATVAEALHYAHTRRLVHRDIKPANILIDTKGKPHVVDFGLALKDEDFGRRAGFAGTPAYMSPEQASGEGHRVDGRSDIFSLGVVMYEWMSGELPFRGESRMEIMEQIVNTEPRPPRQMDDTLPKELERICLKALSKRVAERYTTAKDMAEDLRHFQLNCGDRAGRSVDLKPAAPQAAFAWNSAEPEVRPKSWSVARLVWRVCYTSVISVACSFAALFWLESIIMRSMIQENAESYSQGIAINKYFELCMLGLAIPVIFSIFWWIEDLARLALGKVTSPTRSHPDKDRFGSL